MMTSGINITHPGYGSVTHKGVSIKMCLSEEKMLMVTGDDLLNKNEIRGLNWQRGEN